MTEKGHMVVNGVYGGVAARIATYFEFDRHETTFTREVLAGAATYLSLAYIFVVNPVILSSSGINPSAALFATVVASSLATFAMGLWAKLPFAVAPGLEMNGYFALVLCGSLGLDWRQGLTAVLLSGVLNVLFTSIQLRDNIVTSIPRGLKRSFIICIGAFIASVALQIAGIITYKRGFITIQSPFVDHLLSHEAFILYIGSFIAVVLGQKNARFPLNIFASLMASFMLCVYWGIGSGNISRISSDTFSAVAKLTPSFFERLIDFRVFAAVVVLFLVDFIGGAGKIVGLSAATNVEDEDGAVPRLKRALYVDGVGTIIGSMLGTSSLVAFVESGVGISAGGRTGLTAIFCALLMSISFLFEPIIGFVPAQAASGVLIYVAYLLHPFRLDKNERLEQSPFDNIVGYVMAAVALLTFGIDTAMGAGLTLYLLRALRKRDLSQSTIWLGILSLIIDSSVIVHYTFTR